MEKSFEVEELNKDTAKINNKVEFTYHRKSPQLKIFLIAVFFLAFFIEGPVAIILIYSLIYSSIIKAAILILSTIIIVFAIVFFASIFMTKHLLTPTALILRQGINLKEKINLSNILKVKKEEIRLGVAFGIRYLAAYSAIQVTTDNSNLILIELTKPHIFKPLLGRRIKAIKIILNVDDSERFLRLINQKISSGERLEKQAEKMLPPENYDFLALNDQAGCGAEGDAIEVINLTKKYGEFIAVSDLNLRVNYGEIFGFIGPNGAGKTTTINTIVGLLKPNSGRIKIGGFDLEIEPLKAKATFGYVAENPIVYENLTGAEFLKFLTKLYPDEESSSAKIEILLNRFNLEEWKDRLIKVYSQGMQRKIAIAGALVHSPRVLILDEPTNGLDPAGAREVRDILFNLRTQGVAIFMSTHLLETAEKMCDRVGIINKGRLIAQGRLAELQKKAKRKETSLEEIFFDLTGSEF